MGGSARLGIAPAALQTLEQASHTFTWVSKYVLTKQNIIPLCTYNLLVPENSV